ncbi:hypothetical protein E3E12_02155 [Formicincola oecophyllae]|uniref:Uncharacterized protein n=1 Tax=Formicincola oecophyllae TaxID=2558361 RepID=A0A4Y6U9T4_9PROT|nr:hypothetical protein [Formicincola oecophyllae]QDH13197.2 hypothetical protein E3E12_02155 [Formicincola oecophyllae]
MPIVAIPTWTMTEKLLVIQDLLLDNSSLYSLGLKPQITHFTSKAHQFITSNPSAVMDITDKYPPFEKSSWEDHYMMTGPYMPLGKGAYCVKVSLRGCFSPLAELNLDIAFNKGQNLLALKSHSNLQQDKEITCAIELPFYVLDDLRDVEIRLRVKGRFTGRVEQVQLLYHDFKGAHLSNI